MRIDLSVLSLCEVGGGGAAGDLIYFFFENLWISLFNWIRWEINIVLEVFIVEFIGFFFVEVGKEGEGKGERVCGLIIV